MATTSNDPRSIWCRYYRGHALHASETCGAGIAYDSVPRPLPCINSTRYHDGKAVHWGQCPQFSEYTKDELDEQDRQSAEALNAFITALDESRCPHCGADVAKRRQVGRCVYADPCGHRLYQGRA